MPNVIRTLTRAQLLEFGQIEIVNVGTFGLPSDSPTEVVLFTGAGDSRVLGPSGSTSTTFLTLLDTPTSYTSDFIAKVNSAGTALEFVSRNDAQPTATQPKGDNDDGSSGVNFDYQTYVTGGGGSVRAVTRVTTSVEATAKAYPILDAKLSDLVYNMTITRSGAITETGEGTTPEGSDYWVEAQTIASGQLRQFVRNYSNSTWSDWHEIPSATGESLNGQAIVSDGENAGYSWGYPKVFARVVGTSELAELVVLPDDTIDVIRS